MLFNQYYKDELAYLQEMGEVFSKAYPGLAPFLAQKGNDPDVERLLQGFAFLSAKIRLKLDDEFPELTHDLFSTLYPAYLRPIPSMSILQFEPLKNLITEKVKVERGIEVESDAIDGTACRFKTCYDVDILPLMIDSINQSNERGGFSLNLHVKLQDNVDYGMLNINRLRFYINADLSTAYTLYSYFFRHLENIVVKSVGQNSDNQFQLDSEFVGQVGFNDNEALLPCENTSFTGFRLLQEYFTLPEKFLFIDLSGLSPIKQFKGSGGFEIKFNFNRVSEESLRINNESLKLFCTPIVNLFSMDADPVRFKDKNNQFSVRPACKSQMHYEVYSVDSATGLVVSGQDKIEYLPFKSYKKNMPDSNEGYFQTNIQQSIIDNGTDTHIKFTGHQYSSPHCLSDVISMSLTCSNRFHAEKISVGEINRHTGSTPEFVTFKNILPLTKSVLPPIKCGLHWQLISNFSLKYKDFNDVESFVSMLSSQNFQSFYSDHVRRMHDSNMHGIISIKNTKNMRLCQGLPMYGYLTEIEMRSHNFSSAGDMYLFCCILNKIFELRIGINSYSQLSVKDLDKNEDYLWPISIV